MNCKPAAAAPFTATVERGRDPRKLRGQKLIVVDIHKHEWSEPIFSRPHPSIDMIRASDLSHYMFDQGYADIDFLRRRVELSSSRRPRVYFHPQEVGRLGVAIGAVA